MSKQITHRRKVNINSNDCYETPEFATHALCEVEKFTGKILEPCCASGKMSNVLKSYGYRVKSQDLFDYGYGKTGRDFLKYKKPIDNMVTNPPLICMKK